MASELEDAARRFQAQLGRREAHAVATMRAALQRVERQIGRELDRVLAKIGAAEQAGRRPGVSFLYERGRLEGLRREVIEQMGRFGGRGATVVSRLTDADAADALTWTARFLEAVGRDTGGRPLAVAPFRPELVAQARANMAEGSPLADLFAKFGPDAAQRVEAGLVNGLALGQHPSLIARRLRGDIVETYTGRAHLIARTESQRVVRAVSSEAYKVHPAAVGWWWFSSRDRTTCAGCWAMHGTFHPPEEVLAGHPGCRCTMVPALDQRPPPGLEPGEQQFAELDPDDQAAVLGPGKLAAYRDGELRLGDLVHRVESERWGPMYREASLVRAREQAARRAGRPRPAPDPTPEPPTPAPPAPTPPPADAALERARMMLEPLERRAGVLDGLADQLDKQARPELRAAARKLRDSWTADSSGAGGAIRRSRSAGGMNQNDNAYAFNAGNANSWHYVNGKRRTLAEYEEVAEAWSRGDPLEDLVAQGFRVPADLEPVSADTLERLAIARDLRTRSGADRRIVDVIRAPDDDWRFDPADRRVAVGEVERAVIEGQRVLKAAQQRAAAPVPKPAPPAAPAAPESLLPEGVTPHGTGPVSRRIDTSGLGDSAEGAATSRVLEVLDRLLPIPDRPGEVDFDAPDWSVSLTSYNGVRRTIRMEHTGPRDGNVLGIAEPEIVGSGPSRVALRAGTVGDDPEGWVAIAHELGHIFDVWGGVTRMTSNLKSAFHSNQKRDALPAMKAFRKKVTELPEWQQLRSVDEASMLMTPGYLTSGTEVWARAFAQWVAERSGDTAFRDAARTFNAAKWPGGQWTAESWRILEPLVDAVLREQGWL